MAFDIGPKRKIFRGGVEENTPQQLERPMAAAGGKPGDVIAVTANGQSFQPSPAGAYFYVLNAPMHQDPITYVYKVGETGFGYVPRSRDVYLMRASAALTVAKDAPLSINALGKIVAQTPAAGETPATPIVGYAHFAVSAAVLDTLIDVRIK